MMRTKHLFTFHAIAGLTAMLTLACGDARNANEVEDRAPASPGPLSVSLTDGTELRGTSAAVHVRFAEGNTPNVEVFFGGDDGASRRWSALARPPVEFLTSGEATGTVTDGQVDEGKAAVQRSEGAITNAVFATQGTLTIHVRNGMLEGTADGMADALAGHFGGPVFVSCSVPPEALGDEPAVITEGEGLILVDDADFKSEACAALKSGPLFKQ
jgi:hypothetical protein